MQLTGGKSSKTDQTKSSIGSFTVTDGTIEQSGKSDQVNGGVRRKKSFRKNARPVEKFMDKIVDNESHIRESRVSKKF